MIRLIVVDDFKADREEIIDIIESFTDLDISIIGICENGVQANDMICDLQPDIVVCDVQMPYMDGFEVLKNTRNLHPDIRFIFCSLYSGINYLKNALDLDCNGYILKPINEAELYESLKTQVEHCNTSKLQQLEHQKLKKMVDESTPFLIDGFVRDLIYGNITDETQLINKVRYFKIGIPLCDYRLCVIEIDNYAIETREMDLNQKQIYTMQLISLVQDYLGNANIQLFRLDDTRLFFMYSSIVDDNDAAKFQDISKYTEQLIAHAHTGAYSITIAISDQCDCLSTLPKAYEQCVYLLRFKYLLGKDRAIFSNEIPGSSSGLGLEIMELQKDIRYVLNLPDKNGIEEFVQQHFRSELFDSELHLKNVCFSVLVFIQIYLKECGTTLEDILGGSYSQMEFFLHFETIKDTSRWMQEILFKVNDYLVNRQKNKTAYIVGEVKKYIEDQILADVCLESIATVFFYSPNHLNMIFKREIGMSIPDYISDLRIELAKTWLCDNQHSIGKIAETLRYSNLSYFALVFKRKTGMTPKEYRLGAVNG